MDVKELEIEKDVLKRIEMMCRFCNVKPIIKCGSIINIKGCNLAYTSHCRVSTEEQSREGFSLGELK